MAQLPPPGGGQRSQQQFIVFEQFEKMNTKDSRVGLKETELAWQENLQPIAPNKLLTVPAAATALQSITETITLAFYAAINNVDYAILFTSAGAGFFLNLGTATFGQFAPDGTFSSAPDVTTWQGQRILINDSLAGYCTWDGTLFVEQGMMSPNITVTAGGQNYSTPPPVTITVNTGSIGSISQSGAVSGLTPIGSTVNLVIGAPPVGGLQAAATATINSATSVTIILTNPGGGYASAPTVTFPASVGGTKPTLTANMTTTGSGNNGAAATAVISGGQVVAVTLTNPGQGFNPTDTIALTFGTTTGSGAVLTPVMSTSAVVGIAIASAGLWSALVGVTHNPTSANNPYALVVSNAGTGGSGATAEAFLAPTNVNGEVLVQSVALLTTGSGYSIKAPTFTWDTTNHPINLGGSTNDSLPTFSVTMANIQVNSVTITNGGTGFAPNATIPLLFSAPKASTIRSAVATASTNVSGVITSINFTDHGSYKIGTTVTASVAPGSGAAATAHVWPFVPAGTTLAVFQGRVWLGGGTLLQWTGTGASYGNVGYDDFLAADASASLQITDADLVHQISALRSLNNYLYIVGDQSVKQIGNISLDATGFVTLFSILTLSSDQGTVYPRSCLSYERIFMFANPNGIYGVFGSTVQKLSADLDGIFKLVDFSQQPQSALLDLNAIHNAVWLLRYRDPVAGTRSIMVIFDGRRWWVASQGEAMVAITSAPLLASDSNVLYGSRTGTDITKLFADATTAVAFKAQTSLTPHGNAVQGKKVIRAGFTADAAGAGTVTFELDADTTTQTLTFAVTAASLLVGGTNDSANTPANVSGVNLGVTITGTLANFVLTNMILEFQETTLWKGA